jgi:recombination protein RecR
MSIFPAPLEKLIQQLSRLPGVGQKSATRVALYILKSDSELAENLARSLLQVKESIQFCSRCHNFTDEDPCPICRDENRANGILCIVEGPGDQLAIEESGAFKGRYHVLHGVLSPLDGIGPEDLKIGELLGRLTKILSDKGVKITRIALGVPMGGDLKYMDSMTLRHALKSRTTVLS